MNGRNCNPVTLNQVRWELEPGIGYLGFRFDVGNGSQFGYAEVEMFDTFFRTGFLHSYCWADAGETLFAGQRPAVPEPNCLCVLALGCVGLMRWPDVLATESDQL